MYPLRRIAAVAACAIEGACKKPYCLQVEILGRSHLREEVPVAVWVRVARLQASRSHRELFDVDKCRFVLNYQRGCRNMLNNVDIMLYAENATAGPVASPWVLPRSGSATREGDPKAVGFEGGESVDIAERLEG